MQDSAIRGRSNIGGKTEDYNTENYPFQIFEEEYFRSCTEDILPNILDPGEFILPYEVSGIIPGRFPP